jgi:type I restriction-modification system DNA methylase subunit
MLLEDDAHGNIAVTDALSSWDDPVLIKKRIRKEGFNVLLTNPPFGKKGRLKEYKDRFQLAKEFETPSFETLVLERGIELLSPGGRLAIVIPDVNLTQKDVLNFIWKNAIILGVVSLPSETFNPYGSGAKTSVLFLRKKKTENEETQRIFMSSIHQIGYDSTGRRKGNGKNYFDEVPDYFHKFLGGEAINTVANDGLAIFILEGDRLSSARENLKVDNYVSYGNLKGKEGVTYVKLGEVAEVLRGYTPGWHEYTQSGVPILKVRNLTNKFIDFDFERRGYVPEEIYKKHPEAHIKQFDILLTASAHKSEYIAKKVDIVDVLPYEKCMCTAELLILRPKENIDPFYLLAVLRKKEVNDQFRGCIRGTTAHIYPDDIKEKVFLPRLCPEKEREIGKSLKEALHEYREFEVKFSQHEKMVKKELS